MLKTLDEIESDLYAMFKDGALGAGIDGEVIRGKRSANATTEDAVITCIECNTFKTQEGMARLNIYVKDYLDADGEMCEDKKRIGELQALVDQTLWEDTSEYTLYVSYSTEHIEAMNQHCLVARITLSRQAS